MTEGQPRMTPPAGSDAAQTAPSSPPSSAEQSKPAPVAQGGEVAAAAAPADPGAKPASAPTQAPAGQPPAQPAKKAFFATLPGVLTAAVTALTAVTALITALNQSPWLQPKPTVTPTATPVPTATAAPSATLAPSATAEPASTPVRSQTISLLPEGAILVDDFSDPSSGWETQTTGDYAIGYQDGAYREYVTTTEYAVWAEPLKHHELTDMAVELDATMLQGPTDSLYGPVVRLGKDGTFYLFALSIPNSFSVQRRDADAFVTLVPWQSSDAIRPQGEVNHIKVECVGARLSFYVNGSMVAEITDAAYASGDVGLLSATTSEPVEAHFDNLQVQALPEAYLLGDDFSDPNSGWEVEGTEEYSVGYADGQYRIYVVTLDRDVWSKPLDDYDLGDMRVEVDAYPLSGPEGALYGLIVRLQSKDAFYLFAVNNNSSYLVQRCDEEGYEPLVGWSTSDAVRPLGEMNHLTVDCLGASMRFYVNGALLAEVVDNHYASGNIGLLASTFEGDPQEVRFDNLQVRPLLRFQ